MLSDFITTKFINFIFKPVVYNKFYTQSTNKPANRRCLMLKIVLFVCDLMPLWL